jgi:hypothetical protein
MHRLRSAGLLLAGVLVAGCQGPVPHVNIMIEVFNQTNEVDSLRWQGPGGSGSDSIEPCTVAGSAEGLGPGTWQFTVQDGPNSLTATLIAPDIGVAYEVFCHSARRPDRTSRPGY